MLNSKKTEKCNMHKKVGRIYSSEVTTYIINHSYILKLSIRTVHTTCSNIVHSITKKECNMKSKSKYSQTCLQ